MTNQASCPQWRITRALALVAALGVPAAAPAGEADLAQRIYERVMTIALAQDVAWSISNPETLGKKNPYRKGKRHKALAACLILRGDAVEGLDVHSSTWGFGYPVANRAKTDVLRECRSEERSAGCTCYLIDVNDGSVVASQSELLARVSR